MNIKRETDHPHYGEVIYDDKGKPTCHICGRSFNKLLNHVWQKHGLSAREYKIKFGLNVSHGIISQATREKLQESVHNNYSKVVEINLIKKGRKTRFKKGNKGRTKDKLSEQERRRLSNRFRKSNQFI